MTHHPWCQDHPDDSVGCVSATITSGRLAAFLSSVGGVPHLVLTGETTLPLQEARTLVADIGALLSP